MFSVIATTLERYGLWGVFVLMLVENLIPIIPSELILPLAGFEAARGRLDPFAAILLATLGSTLGGSAWYGLGRVIGLDGLRGVVARSGRWLPISPGELAWAEAWFARWGGIAVFAGRTLPGIRGVICIPPGLARMDFGAFLSWSTLGAALWSALLIGSGYWLNANYVVVQRWLNPVADGFLALVVLTYLVRVVRGR